ncbi:tRNA lysidine(34) synthetase TilS [Pragia fontium]|uniref:tRNA lysidine(34) synthetase TilS n=1 Tax=Pragia fontium TaxID=82985 RepID=UPI0006494E56|nr:tRNA lysidine(34) synthetase TilS [Pragia fontium]AKJ43021.1 tRNA(Ile)-lysidine ligase [Pragia fontium]
MGSHEVIQQIAKRLGRDKRILVAFSGGIDSSVLLHALVTLRSEQHSDLQLRAIYVHHGLSRYAQAWAEHCRAQCAQWQIPFQVAHVDVDPSEAGIEAAAREARYQAISALLNDGEVLATAQHLDDQCETFLLALKRGSGPAGLSAMPFNMPFGVHRQIRPMLDISRLQIEDYAKKNGLSWVEDDSNQDARFDRNFLRLQILPAIAQRWPHFSNMVSRSAGLCAEQESLLDELLAPDLSRLMSADGAMEIDGLMHISEMKRRAILRRWLSQHQVLMPSQEQLEKLWHEVALSKPDAEPVLQLGMHQVRRYRQRLYLLPLFQGIESVVLAWRGETSLMLPDCLGQLTLAESGIHVRAPTVEEKVTVRFSAPGSLTVRVTDRRHSRELKKLWQELGVPPWLRQRTPLLFYGEILIAAIGLFVTQEGQPVADKPVWCIHYDKNIA